MPETRVTMPDGQVVVFPEGMSDDAITSAMRQITNPPPPGVMIHEAGRSYIAPELGVTGAPLQVDTRGMASGVGMDAAPSKPGLPSREEAAAALRLRQEGARLPQWTAPLLQGATSGYGDELSSAAFGAGQMLKGGSFGSGYNLAQEAQRQELAQERQEHPYRSAGLQIGGALAQAPWLAKTGLPGLAATPNLSLGGRILGGAATGAGYGAVTGFGEGSGFEDRTANMLPGAAAGLAVGGAIPLVGEGIRKLTNYGLDQSTIGRNLRGMGVGRPAGNAAMRSLEADDAFQTGRANLLAAGPQSMLADVGPATQGLLDTAVQRGGGGSLAARQAIEQRGTAAHQTLTEALDTALGQPRGLQTMQHDISAAGKGARRSAYDTAYSSPIDYSTQGGRELEGLINNRVPADAITAANAKMRIRGEPPSAQIRMTIDDNGNAIFDRLPDVRQVDYITRALRERAESPDVVGALGGKTGKATDYLDLAGDIRTTARKLVPEYGHALDTAADDIGRVQATRLGSEILSPSMTRDETVRALARHQNSAAEMAQVRAGLRSQIDDTMANVRAIATNPNQDIQETARILGNLNSRATQDKIDMVVTDPLVREQMRNQIAEATRAIQLRANMTTNSKTFGRGAQEEAKREMLEPGPLGAAARGHPVNALQRATQALTGRTPQWDVSREDAMNRQIAELLTVARGPQAQQQLDRLRQSYVVGPQNAAQAQQTGGWTGILAGLPGYQALRELMGR